MAGQYIFSIQDLLELKAKLDLMNQNYKFFNYKIPCLLNGKIKELTCCVLITIENDNDITFYIPPETEILMFSTTEFDDKLGALDLDKQNMKTAYVAPFVISALGNKTYFSNITLLGGEGLISCREMFYQTDFNIADLRMFRPINSIDFESMFEYAKIEQLKIDGMQTTNAKSMRKMFKNCSVTSISKLDIDTSKVEDMEAMFVGANFNCDLDLSSFDTSHVKEVRYMFQYMSCYNIDLSSFSFESILTDRIEHLHVFDGTKISYKSKLKSNDPKFNDYMINMITRAKNRNQTSSLIINS